MTNNRYIVEIKRYFLEVSEGIRPLNVTTLDRKVRQAYIHEAPLGSIVKILNDYAKDSAATLDSSALKYLDARAKMLNKVDVREKEHNAQVEAILKWKRFRRRTI